MTTIDEEIIVDVDLEKAVPCDFGRVEECSCGNCQPCDDPAEWKLIRSCCGLQEVLCTVHKETQINWVTHYSVLLYCGNCASTNNIGYSVVEPL